MPDLYLELLGGFEARTADGVSLSFPTKKTKALLAYLSAHPGKSHSRNELAALLWANSTEEHARASLRQTLACLRKALAPTGLEHLVTQGDLVSIDPATLQADVAMAERLTADSSPDGLEPVIELYRGDLLEGFDLPEEEFNDWLRAERLRLRRLVTAVLGTILAHYEATDQVAAGIRIANRLLEIDPLQEHAHRSLMRLLLRQGERALALRQYDICRETLMREVDSEPDEETRQVWNEARAAKLTHSEWERRTFSAGRGFRSDVASKPAQRTGVEDQLTDDLAPLEIRYCTTRDGVRLAYGALGNGFPLVKTASFMTHLEYDTESPLFRHWIRELSKEHRYIRYDERGNGLSDWHVDEISFEAFVNDLETVVDDMELDRFALLGISQGASVSIEYARRHPDRVNCLVIYGGFAAGWRKSRDVKHRARREAMLELTRSAWGDENPAGRQVYTSMFMPEATPEQQAAFNRLQQVTSTAEIAYRILDTVAEIDVGPALKDIEVPTLVLHCKGDAVTPFETGREIAATIPGAQFIPLDGVNHIIQAGDPGWSRFLSEVRGFVSQHV